MNTATRTLVVIPPAMVVTTVLLAIMITLIGNRDEIAERIETRKLPNIVMPEVEVVEAKAIKKPTPPVVQETPPPEVPPQYFEKLGGENVITKVVAPTIIAGTELTLGDGLSHQDGEYLPIIKPAPVYPNRAISRGIEGNVTVEYTVTKNGSVRNPHVVKSTSSLFDQSAMASTLKYKYKPRVINGSAVEVPGVRTMITFRLEK